MEKLSAWNDNGKLGGTKEFFGIENKSCPAACGHLLGTLLVVEVFFYKRDVLGVLNTCITNYKLITGPG